MKKKMTGRIRILFVASVMAAGILSGWRQKPAAASAGNQNAYMEDIREESPEDPEDSGKEPTEEEKDNEREPGNGPEEPGKESGNETEKYGKTEESVLENFTGESGDMTDISEREPSDDPESSGESAGDDSESSGESTGDDSDSSWDGTEGDTGKENPPEKTEPDDPGSTQIPTASPGLKKADLRLSMKADTEKVKAGSSLVYEIVLENCGQAGLSDVRLENVFSGSELEGEWEPSPGLRTAEGALESVLETLGEGETRKLYFTAEIPEEYEGTIMHTLRCTARKATTPEIYGGFDDPASSDGQDGPVIREVTLKTEVIPLKIEFSVKKTADRTTAVPGDTVVYQICIRNTGERVLHSVLTTERFRNRNIQAHFRSQDGVILNGAKTQALIPKIEPGEAYGLLAEVTIPEGFAAGELFNEVVVITKETGEKKVTAGSGVEILSIIPSPTETPLSATAESSLLTGQSTPASTQPKTGDASESLLWLGMMLTAGICGMGSFCVRMKSRH